MTQIKPRPVPPRIQWQLEQQGVHPLLARIYAARGIQTKSELDYELKSLIPPAQLTHAADAAVLLARHAGRVATVHVKDYRVPMPGGRAVLTELGRGTMDWDRVLPAAKEAGARWFIVEQDNSESDSMESAAVNAAFMKACNQE